MSKQVTSHTSADSDPLADVLAAGFLLVIGKVIFDELFKEPEPKRTISGHSEADFAEIIRLLEQQS